ncbi:uncharacterized protein PAN0_002c1111 [Moesziomyces antarcticus]|uniref:Uncharacterized protein n=1 Tax=Pseudozyma antarctica TaxID=84753 RepID=A0A5C3FIM2_PSEA2|nr:uncharacterized protein PAN0_002c1111 [Moesziomyces antarcticus]GAK62909.1 conserved hypothetical protein [Moesziomyces antarcticus]SPO43615.1 uncharacterized protein PSANT_01300 [Moesziomyces antarcticus]
MRSHTLARAVLRAAARGPASRALVRPALPTAAAAAATPASQWASAQAFSSSSRSLKKKAKKSLVVEEDFAAEEESDEFAIEDDDLFGSVADAGTSASATPAAAETSRVEMVKALEDYRTSLEWDVLDAGRFPSLSRFRALAGRMGTREELEQMLDIAKLYRDRVGSLGVECGRALAARAARIQLPELALNSFLDRYTYGLEYDMESLYLLQTALTKKLNRNDRAELLESAELPGAPTHETDLFGVVPSETAAAAAEGEEGKAEAISRKHELDMPLARAQISVIDRMTMLTTLAQTLRPNSGTYDALLLSHLPHAYITTFRLTSNRNAPTNPLLKNVFAQTDALISMLTSAAHDALTHPTQEAYLMGNETLVHARSVRLYHNLAAALSYVAMRGTDTAKRTHKDPVKTLYTYMDHLAPNQANTLIRKIEPLLQTYESKKPLANA